MAGSSTSSSDNAQPVPAPVPVSRQLSLSRLLVGCSSLAGGSDGRSYVDREQAKVELQTLLDHGLTSFEAATVDGDVEGLVGEYIEHTRYCGEEDDPDDPVTIVTRYVPEARYGITKEDVRLERLAKATAAQAAGPGVAHLVELQCQALCSGDPAFGGAPSRRTYEGSRRH